MRTVNAKLLTPSCSALAPSDARAAGLCREMARAMHIPPAALGRGVRRIDYRASGALPEGRTVGVTFEPTEIYQRLLEHSLTGPVSRRAHALIVSRFGSAIPWLPDAKHRPIVEHTISRAALDARAKTPAGAPSPEATRIRAQSLLDALRAPLAAGGLGLRYEEHEEHDGDINIAIDRGYANCSEFQAIYVAMARRLGLEAHPIAIPRRAKNGDEKPHAAVMLVDAVSKQRFFADLQDDDVTTTPPPSPYYVGTAANIFTTHLYNQSFVHEDGTARMTTRDDALLLQGLVVAPDDAVLLMGLGVYHYQRDEEERALPYFRRVLELLPQHISARKYICAIDPGDKACTRPATPSSQPVTK